MRGPTLNLVDQTRAAVSAGIADRRPVSVSRDSAPRLVLLIPRAVCFLVQRKASHFVKASGPHIALERPKLQAIERAFGDLQQPGADATPLRVWQRVQLVDPVLSEGDHSGHPSAVESPPDLAGFKHALP